MVRRKRSGNDVSTLPSRRKLGRRILQVRLPNKENDIEINTQHFPHKDLDVGDIDESNQEFIKILEQLGQKVKELGIDFKQADYFPQQELEKLKEEGRIAYKKVFSKPNIRDYLQNQETKAQQKNRGLSFTFTFPPNLSLFWEFLYSGSSLEPFNPEQFWGFRYPLGRSYWEIEDCDCIEFRTGILAAIHHRLIHSRQEIETISQQLQEVCQRRSWKLKVQFLDKQFDPNSLCITELLRLFQQEEFQYGIVHFACHCLNSPPNAASQSFLYLSIHNKDLKLTIKLLKGCEEEGFKNQPFVFLNACDSATSGHPLQAISFPTSMLGFGAGGVIATNCLIPDNFASAFASEFYRRLLEKLENNLPVRVGEVLLETRLHFWEQYHNPLGLAYGLYAVSDQQLAID